MRFHNITTDDMLNGDGLRVVLWVSGCSHKCKECQNSITWDANDGLIFDSKTKEELYKELSKDYINGITFSGGDPLFYSNKKQITQLSQEIRRDFPNKTQWLYTGYLWEDIKDLELMQFLDVVIDGPFKRKLKDITLKWRGSSNQRVIDVQKSISNETVVLYCD